MDLLNKNRDGEGQRVFVMPLAKCQETNQFMLQERQKIANK